jgi:hypothetical protein
MLPISDKWMSATNWKINDQRCKAKNHWRSVHTNSKNGSLTILLSLSPVQASNTSGINDNYQVTAELLSLQDKKSLTLH